MKVNVLMMLVILSIGLLLGLMGVEYYSKHEAVAAGLQQCVTNVDGKNQVIWTKECDK